ncbi:hypothetical protein, partial [Streptomyces sp. NPDC058964]|uniref:hypothetical protein n=1 Tax=Streptomyces sp. NPDC058964 TaxID=3346681 RepID=UPI0036C213CE
PARGRGPPAGGGGRPRGRRAGRGPPRRARARWTATVAGIFAGGVLGTLLLVPLGTGRALLVIAAVVLLLAAGSLAAPRKVPGSP